MVQRKIKIDSKLANKPALSMIWLNFIVVNFGPE